MCHLAPYAKNMVDKEKHVTQMTRYFSELNMAVDFSEIVAAKRKKLSLIL